VPSGRIRRQWPFTFAVSGRRSSEMLMIPSASWRCGAAGTGSSH